MELETLTRGIKNLGRTFLLDVTFGSFFLFNSCQVGVDGDITVKKEPVGEIVGKVLWDPDEDGIYTGISGATVQRFSGHWPSPITETATGGGYSFHEVPIGTYSLRGLKIVRSPSYSVWEEWESASVTKGNVTNMDIFLKRNQ